MDTRLYLADIEPLYDLAIYTAYFDKMPPDRQAKTLRYKGDKDRIRSVAAYALLTRAYTETANDIGEDANSDLINIAYKPSGKAYIKDSRISFNLSHSGKRVLCCIGLDENGCDVEVKKDDAIKIAKRFFNKAEYEYILSHKEDESLFTKIWTMKESVLKACGTGISYPMDSFSVVDSVGFAKKITLSDDLGVYYIKNYPADESHEISCACRVDGFEECVRVVRL